MKHSQKKERYIILLQQNKMKQIINYCTAQKLAFPFFLLTEETVTRNLTIMFPHKVNTRSLLVSIPFRSEWVVHTHHKCIYFTLTLSLSHFSDIIFSTFWFLYLNNWKKKKKTFTLCCPDTSDWRRF